MQVGLLSTPFSGFRQCRTNQVEHVTRLSTPSSGFAEEAAEGCRYREAFNSLFGILRSSIEESGSKVKLSTPFSGFRLFNIV